MLDKKYNATEKERKWLDYWKENKIYEFNPNQNKEVYIFRYVTEKTFDAYLYQLIENKQKFISQIMTSKVPLRTASDVDEAVLSYSEIKALASASVISSPPGLQPPFGDGQEKRPCSLAKGGGITG